VALVQNHLRPISTSTRVKNKLYYDLDNSPRLPGAFLTNPLIMLRFLAIFFFFAAFLLLLLTSLSLPIIKSIIMFDIWLNADTGSFLNSGVEGSVSFGVWGYCISDVVVQ
jgi:hypothetical protein